MVKLLDSFQSVNYKESVAFWGDINRIFFRKEVLEQKVTAILGSLNFTRKVRYKVGKLLQSMHSEYLSSISPGGRMAPPWTRCRPSSLSSTTRKRKWMSTRVFARKREYFSHWMSNIRHFLMECKLFNFKLYRYFLPNWKIFPLFQGPGQLRLCHHRGLKVC